MRDIPARQFRLFTVVIKDYTENCEGLFKTFSDAFDYISKSAKVPERGGWSRDIEEFSSLVIIPLNYAHDSGWMCMNFVAVNKDGEPICRLSGCSDVLNLDGIGGYGYRD